MMMELIPVGILVGAMSGFFGIGGGTILVPILLAMGFSTKDAIGISIIQMVFSSIYGSYLNHKKGSLILGDGILVGLGGFVGGFIGGYLNFYFSVYFSLHSLGSILRNIMKMIARQERSIKHCFS